MTDGVGIFDLDVRVVACKSCGAPLRVEVRGGTYTCEYCSAINRLVTRAQAGFAPTTMPESERIAALRLAVGNQAPTPALDYVVDGTVPSYFRRKAKEQWTSLRAQLDTSSAFVLKEKLFHLTVALVPSLETEEQRAFLETAIDALDDERFRHLLLCQMARMAARHGEVSAAEAWLAACNPRSCDLQSDSAYRYAAAVIAAENGDATRIHEQLGFEEGELPFAKRDENAVRILRIHAKELGGRSEEAGRELLGRMYKVGIEQLRSEIERCLPQSLCASSMAWAEAQYRAADEEKAAHEKAESEESHEREIATLRAELASMPVLGVGHAAKAMVLAAAITLAAGLGRLVLFDGSLLDITTLLCFPLVLAIVLAVGIRARRSRRVFIERRLEVLSE